MTRVERFLWVDWAQAESCQHNLDELGTVIEASHDGYQSIGANHKRSVLFCEREDWWIVVDDIVGEFYGRTRLHWLFADSRYAWCANESRLDLASPVGRFRCALFAPRAAMTTLVRAGEVVTSTSSTVNRAAHEIFGWRSLYYGDKEPALSLAIEIDSCLPMRFVTVLAPGEVDAVAAKQEIKLSSRGITYRVLLHAPGGERAFAKLDRTVDS